MEELDAELAEQKWSCLAVLGKILLFLAGLAMLCKFGSNPYFLIIGTILCIISAIWIF
jgi:hypothetical protein